MIPLSKSEVSPLSCLNTAAPRSDFSTRRKLRHTTSCLSRTRPPSKFGDEASGCWSMSCGLILHLHTTRWIHSCNKKVQVTAGPHGWQVMRTQHLKMPGSLLDDTWGLSTWTDPDHGFMKTHKNLATGKQQNNLWRCGGGDLQPHIKSDRKITFPSRELPNGHRRP